MENRQGARGFRAMGVLLLAAGVAGGVSSATTTDPPGSPIMAVKVGNVTIELVRIPAGRFLMGSTTGDPDETPVHEVRIGHDFYMGRTEVTVRQFRAFAEATGYKTDAEQIGWANTCPQPGLHPNERGLHWRRPGFELQDDQPAVVVSWNDAMAFCRWLSAQTGRHVRLPTEAEWEYAARAAGREDSSSRLEDTAWYEGNAADRAHPVATQRPNPWGLYDMQGNAWEWCLDVWRPDYRAAAPDGRAVMHDPVVPQAVWRYVQRGGSWFSPIRQLSLSYRARCLSHFCRPDSGFRIVLDPVNGSRYSAVGRDKGNARAQPTTNHTDSATSHTLVTVPGARFAFVRIPAGEFLMGGTGEIEKPVHKVRIGYDFEMGTTEVTVGQFRAFIQATGYPTDGQKVGVSWTRGPDTDWESEEAVPWGHAVRDLSDDHPAIFISWYDAMEFCHWLSRETGQEIRLPSEAEWEHACRAHRTGLYAGELSAMGWYQYNACGRTHPVAQKQPNAWGLYDMHGNVWEWCLDFFAISYDGAPTDGRPRREVPRASDVVSRGGSFRNPPGWLASGCRMGSFPDCSHGNNGFRLVRVLPRHEDRNRDPQTPEPNTPISMKANTTRLIPLKIDLPRPRFVGIPTDCFHLPNFEKPLGKPRPPFLVPVGTTNVAHSKNVTCGQGEPFKGDLSMITDGDKEADDGRVVELDPSAQSVTIDLEERHSVYAIVIWHWHRQPRIYHDVVVQVADDPAFAAGVTTVFNNDLDNSAGLGVGKDLHYLETHEGKLIDARGVPGRYVRLWSNGNTSDDRNHYIEVEVYGELIEQ